MHCTKVEDSKQVLQFLLFLFDYDARAVGTFRPVSRAVKISNVCYALRVHFFCFVLGSIFTVVCDGAFVFEPHRVQRIPLGTERCGKMEDAELKAACKQRCTGIQNYHSTDKEEWKRATMTDCKKFFSRLIAFLGKHANKTTARSAT